MSGKSVQEMMAEIAVLAKVKKHHLAPDMVNGRRQLTEASARMALLHLHRCADIARPDPDGSRMPAPAGASRPAAAPVQPAAPQQPSLPVLAAFKDIPEGYYATVSRTGSNDLDFWRVDKPAKGKWEGYSFARRILGGGDGSEMRTVDLPNIQQRLALQAIREAGTDQAKMAFATAIDRCSDCGRMLTDEISRQVGKGPTCRARSQSR